MRLKPSAGTVNLDLDLRTPAGISRSRLLHRLNLLGIPWGSFEKTDSRKKGTFHEFWSLRWEPEFSVRIIEAGMWGGTVESAAAAKAVKRADEAESIDSLAQLVNAVILSELPAATLPVVDRLRSRCARSNDVTGLMTALPSLVAILRYGSVRQTDVDMITDVVGGFITRICIGLPPACLSLDDEAAADMAAKIQMVHQATLLLDDEAHNQDWLSALKRMMGMFAIHDLARGKICRLLLDAGNIDGDQAVHYMGLAISPGNEPARAAAWIEGFLAESGLVLLHDAKLWQVIDDWLTTLSKERFLEILPLVRRTFSAFPASEREELGRRAKAGRSKDNAGTGRIIPSAEDQNPAWGDRAVQTILELMGLANG